MVGVALCVLKHLKEELAYDHKYMYNVASYLLVHGCYGAVIMNYLSIIYWNQE